MFCTNCGAKLLDDNVDVCLSCGKQVKKTTQINQKEGSNIGFGILGFFIPLVGLILFFVWNDTKPKQAKSAGIGALISTIISTVTLIFASIIFFFAMSLI